VTIYVVKTNGTEWDTIYGLCTTPETAIEVAHKVQDAGLLEGEHLEVCVLETDKFIGEGA
jgi:hypothetical protein